MWLSFILPQSAASESSALTGGVTFTSNALYTMAKTIDVMPHTFEAVVEMPSATTDNRCILGSYISNNAASINFEIRSGYPYMYYNAGGSASVKRYNFDKVTVNTGEPVRVTVVYDNSKGTLSCFVNGALKQTLDAAPLTEIFERKGLTEILPK